MFRVIHFPLRHILQRCFKVNKKHALTYSPSYVPLVATISHATLAVALTAIVGRGLYFSYKSLSPTQSTRPRLANRERLVPVFSALAALSLALAARSTSQYASISYSKWADERGIDSGGW